MVDKLGFVVTQVSDIMFILKEPKNILTNKWDSNPNNAGYTAFGFKIGDRVDKFKMIGYCTTHECGPQVIDYMVNNYDRDLTEIVVCPAKTLEELGYRNE